MAVENQADPFGALREELEYSFISGNGKRDESG